MNKYKRAFNTIGDTITYYKICKDLGSLHSDNEIFDSIDLETYMDLESKKRIQELTEINMRLVTEKQRRNKYVD